MFDDLFTKAGRAVGWSGEGLLVRDLRTMVCPVKEAREQRDRAGTSERLVRPQRAISAAARGPSRGALTTMTIVRDLSTVICPRRHPSPMPSRSRTRDRVPGGPHFVPARPPNGGAGC